MQASDCCLLTFDVENVAYMHLPFDGVRYSPNASSNVNYFLFFVADVKCGLYEINKNNRASPIQKMFQDRTEAMLDWRGPGPGPGPLVLFNDFPSSCLNKRNYCKVQVQVSHDRGK